MSIYFSAETIYNYVFSKILDCNDLVEIEKSKVREFCNILEFEIHKRSDNSIFYRYVIFGLSEYYGIEDFFDRNRDKFLDFGDRVIFIQKPTFEMANKIESKYGDKIIIDALRTARYQIRC